MARPSWPQSCGQKIRSPGGIGGLSASIHRASSIPTGAQILCLRSIGVLKGVEGRTIWMEYPKKKCYVLAEIFAWVRA